MLYYFLFNNIENIKKIRIFVVKKGCVERRNVVSILVRSEGRDNVISL